MSYPINPIYPPGGVNGDVQKNNNGQFGKAANTDIATGLAGTSIDQTKVICTSEGIGIGTGNTPVSELEVDSSSAASPRGITSVQNSTDTNAAVVNGRKARGTRSAPSLIVTGDELAEYSATGYDGSVYLKMAKILAKAVGTVGANRIPTELSFWTATDAAPSVLTQRMVIDKAGNVGIGTTAPGEKLEVAGAIKTTGAVATALASSGVFDYGGGTRIWSYGPDASTRSNIQFKLATATGTSVLSPMIIDNSGNVGIGTTGPLANLHVTSPTATSGTSNIFGYVYGSTGPGTFVDVAGATRTKATFVVGTNYNDVSGNVLNVYSSSGGDGLLFVKASGNVGIATTSPGATLDIAKTNTLTFRVYDQTATTGITRAQFRAGAGDIASDKLIKGVLNDGTTEKWSITRDGNIACSDIDTGSGAVKLAAGTYTPTLTNTANVSASTPYSCQYQRIGNIVTVSGKVDVTATTTLTDAQLSISLPIASNLANANECAGTAFAPLVAGQGAAILGDATNDVAIMQWQAIDTNSRAMFFTFTYRII